MLCKVDFTHLSKLDMKYHQKKNICSALYWPILKFWQIPILTNSNSDKFQFWQFPILTNSNWKIWKGRPGVHEQMPSFIALTVEQNVIKIWNQGKKSMFPCFGHKSNIKKMYALQETIPWMSICTAEKNRSFWSKNILCLSLQMLYPLPGRLEPVEEKKMTDLFSLPCLHILF